MDLWGLVAVRRRTAQTDALSAPPAPAHRGAVMAPSVANAPAADRWEQWPLCLGQRLRPAFAWADLGLGHRWRPDVERLYWHAGSVHGHVTGEHPWGAERQIAVTRNQFVFTGLARSSSAFKPYFDLSGPVTARGLHQGRIFVASGYFGPFERAEVLDDRGRFRHGVRLENGNSTLTFEDGTLTLTKREELYRPLFGSRAPTIETTIATLKIQGDSPNEVRSIHLKTSRIPPIWRLSLDGLLGRTKPARILSDVALSHLKSRKIHVGEARAYLRQTLRSERQSAHPTG